MPECPDCGHSPLTSYPTTVTDPTLAAEYQSNAFLHYTGVSATESEVINSSPAVRVTIDQDAYATENFFKHRRRYEQMDHITLEDVSSGEVRVIIHEGGHHVTAFKCSECDLVWDPDLGRLD